MMAKKYVTENEWFPVYILEKKPTSVDNKWFEVSAWTKRRWNKAFAEFEIVQNEIHAEVLKNEAEKRKEEEE